MFVNNYHKKLSLEQLSLESWQIVSLRELQTSFAFSSSSSSPLLPFLSPSPLSPPPLECLFPNKIPKVILPMYSLIQEILSTYYVPDPGRLNT